MSISGLNQNFCKRKTDMAYNPFTDLTFFWIISAGYMDALLCFLLFFSCFPFLTFQFLIGSNPHWVNTVTTFAMCVSRQCDWQNNVIFVWDILICGYCYVSAAAKPWLTPCCIRVIQNWELAGLIKCIFSIWWFPTFLPFNEHIFLFLLLNQLLNTSQSYL